MFRSHKEMRNRTKALVYQCMSGVPSWSPGTKKKQKGDAEWEMRRDRDPFTEGIISNSLPTQH